ncbi:hypothetical protein [Roseospira visakhapatnamensis]|uniref:ABC-type polysaccharide/polyol phosphate export permease n=1 Tax=Roseospira visakhapatnamensis TaxID=390880 RepID=A0A7W6WBG7_9PROT|nr:hypothetical protein [Roseospira visakhapatnamensis]MBB4267486.1 ABC-type polysaccharide/polyol phosphate export permease [Roseospira visakhapatnamensis]
MVARGGETVPAYHHGRAGWALARQARLARRVRHPLGRPGTWGAPLGPLLVYLPLVASGTLPSPPDGLPAVAYAALGYLTWSLLIDVILAPARGLGAHRADVHAPPAAVLAGLLEAAERSGARGVVLLPLAWAVAGGLDPPGLLAALALLPLALALALGLGLALAVWAVPWPDLTTGAATTLRLTLLPGLVLFPLPDASWAWAVTVLNPLALWTDVLRSMAAHGAVPAGLGLALTAWSLGGVALALVTGRAFVRLAPRLREMAP